MKVEMNASEGESKLEMLICDVNKARVTCGDAGGLDLILVDEKGDRIQACIRGKLISKFQHELEEGVHVSKTSSDMGINR
ncbi:unnamed protein product [Thlaspi arvense]|uniref:Replication protein A 70 kDa DNA-binding subunit B/D first OB fold domain-containing protein n=1 Tax=Thlaspi arvense TaxID=13288 RepID=A0AAU9RQC7_THLAR|nr:unnamed protein product [Thlaspi arvense]